MIEIDIMTYLLNSTKINNEAIETDLPCEFKCPVL